MLSEKGPRFECSQEKGSNKMGEAFVRYVQGNDEDGIDIEEAIMDISLLTEVISNS